MTGRPWWELRAGKDLEHDLQDPSEDWHVCSFASTSSVLIAVTSVLVRTMHCFPTENDVP